MNAVITERQLYIGHTERLTVPPFEVRCCNCGTIVWSSQYEGAGRSVTMDEILFRISTHPCSGVQSPDGAITQSSNSEGAL